MVCVFLFFYLFISCELSSSARGRSLNGTWLDCKVSPPLKGHLWIGFIFKQGMMVQKHFSQLSKVAPLCAALNRELHTKNKRTLQQQLHPALLGSSCKLQTLVPGTSPVQSLSVVIKWGTFYVDDRQVCSRCSH